MVANAPTGARPARLNPFAFPSDTDFRFALLIVAALGATLFLYRWLYLYVPGKATAVQASYRQCEQFVPAQTAARAAPADPGAAIVANAAAMDRVRRCMAPLYHDEARWELGGVALVVAVAGALYWLFPTWKLRRDGLVPLDDADMPGLRDQLAALCAEAGLAPAPRFVWNPLAATGSVQAFGRRGRYFVALAGGLVARCDDDAAAFRAKVRHELAHLRNADVDKTYLTIAIGCAFVSAALLPFAVSLVRQPWDWALSLLWRAAALLALVGLSGAGVLRAREFYADVRASVWDGPEGALARVLELLPRPRPGRWRELGRLHPDPAARRAILADTASLFRVGFWEAVGVGMAAMLAAPAIADSLYLLSPDVNAQTLATAILFAPIVVGIVGLGAWRSAFAALARGEEAGGAGRLALALTLGAVLGQFVTFDTALEPAVSQASVGRLLGAYDLLLLLFLLAGLWFALRWIMLCAVTWLDARGADLSPRLPYAAGLAIAATALAGWFALLLQLQTISTGLAALADGAGVPGAALVLGIGLGGEALLALPQSPLTPLVLLALWAFPLAAGRRRPPPATPGWAYLETGPAMPTRRLPALQTGRAVLAGLASGAVYCGVLLLIRLALQAGLSPAARDADQYKLLLSFGSVAVAALVQVAVAAHVAGRVPRLGVMHGLCAAFVAGCVMGVGFLAINVLLRGTLSSGFVWDMLSMDVNIGALLCLPFAAVRAGRASRRRAEDAPVAARPATS